MLPKRPSTEIQDTFIAQGCFIKSPPSYLFSKRASWKERKFKLLQTLPGFYIIRYYAVDGATEKLKGEIAVSDINSIELGSNTMERIPAITRLFNNSPQNILCIKTSDRCFYLVDESKKNITDWQKSLTDVWVKIHKKENAGGPKIAHTNLVFSPPDPPVARLPAEIRDLAVYPIQSQQAAEQLVRSHQYGSQTVLKMDEATRPKSYPEDHPCSNPAMLDAQDRQRSLTDPKARRGLPSRPTSDQEPFKKPSEILDNIAMEQKNSHICSDPTPAWCSKNSIRRSAMSGQSRESEDTAYSSESESIYDTPRSLAVCTHCFRDSGEEEEDSDGLDSPDGDVYLPMWSLQQNSFDSEKGDADSAGQSRSSHDAQGGLGDEKQNDSVPPKPPRHSRLTEPNKCPKPQGSQLKKVNILKMMYEQDSLDYVTKHLTVPTAHLQQHLNLQEVGERLCVSKWKGPVEIGCVFCHGDHIESVNGFRPESKEFFFQMLERSIHDKVDLVVMRNKKASVFHVEGCNCGRS